MNKRRLALIALIVVMAIGLGFFDLPYSTQQKILPFLANPTETENSGFLAEQKIHLGLDLQGGTQLDYKIDLSRVAEADRQIVIDGVFEVITKRVNGLGVAEPNIYRSTVADEEHIVVELAGIKDIEKAKEIVGKTIQLEFKEENQNPTMSESEIQIIENTAQSALDRILDGENFNAVAKEAELEDPTRVTYFSSGEESYTFASNMNADFLPYLNSVEIGNTVSNLIQTNDGYTVDASGNLVPLDGFYIVNLIDRREGEKTVTTEKEVRASHILIAYEGASGSSATRTKEEAQTLAEELHTRLTDNGEDLATLANEFSDDPSGKATGGDLEFFKSGDMVPAFEETAFSMNIGDISQVVETEYGFHIIQVTDIKEATETTTPETEYNIEKIYFATTPDPWSPTALTGEHFVRANVEFNQNYEPYVSIQFNDEGATLFEELTGSNINKRLAIFVGGQLISAPNVNEKIGGGSAQISGQFTIEEATNLARDLNTGAIPAPIILVGQSTIGASLGQEALDASLFAGLIGVLILMTFMLLYYRLPGLLANIALCIYSIMLIFVIKVAMPIALALIISLGIFCILVSIILKSDESIWEKMLSFLLACFILFFFTYLLANPITLTLAGVAGVVLSIGMAVDANILIFERIKEELHNGRPLSGAVEIGFDRAWSSIRDSNFSSLITCAILIYFGSSITKGFAINLALGILISMFTAITITRTFLRTVVGTKLGANNFLMCKPKKGHTTFRIVQKRKLWFAISGLLILAS
ncbi:MAG: peptidylprolyl isomerase, partial [Candidatus Gracilibacteria bacterium]